MSSSSHTKYFTFFYWNKTDKLITSALKHSRFIFEPSYSESIHRLIRNVDRVYFLIANIEAQRIEAIVKQTDYKNGIMKFEHKTKCIVRFNEIEESKAFKNRDISILQRKLNATYLPVFEAEVSEVYEREIEMFEDIRDIMKEKYKENKKQQETIATYDKMINTPLIYQLLNYQQMCYAMQHNQNQRNQPGQLPPVFRIPGVMNYQPNDCYNNNHTSNIGSSQCSNNSAFSFNHLNGSGFLIGNALNQNREKYFDIKDIGRYIELEKKLKKDNNDDNCFYLSTLKEDMILSNPNSTSKQEVNSKASHSDKKKERKLSRSRSKSRSSCNKISKKINNNYNNQYILSDEEGFYAKKMSNQSNYNNNSKMMVNNNQIQSNYISKQNYSNNQKQQQSYQNQSQQHHYEEFNDKNQQQQLQEQQRPQYYQDSSSSTYHDNNRRQLSYPHKYPMQSSTSINNSNSNKNELKIIDMSNRKKIVFNRDKKPDIRINPPNKFYNK